MSRPKKANICFNCSNAVPDNKGHGCPWSRDFEPVSGWTAEPVVLNPGRKYERTETYQITACPLFDPDDDEHRCIPEPVAVRCTETGVVFKSIGEAARAIGCIPQGISGACKRGGGYAYGYHWEVVEEMD